jgi:sugar/nucleoside kinase (ribokinase family)
MQAKMLYFNSSTLLEPSTQSSLLKAIDVSKKFGGVIFFDLNLPLPLWSSSKESPLSRKHGNPLISLK